MVKSMCVRFNLDNEADRKAWEKIHNGSKSANRAIIDAINENGNDSIAETVRDVLKEFFSAGQPVAIPEKQQETDLQDVDFDFLGG
jgi:hypothetical protein